MAGTDFNIKVGIEDVTKDGFRSIQQNIKQGLGGVQVGGATKPTKVWDQVRYDPSIHDDKKRDRRKKVQDDQRAQRDKHDTHKRTASARATLRQGVQAGFQAEGQFESMLSGDARAVVSAATGGLSSIHEKITARRMAGRSMPGGVSDPATRSIGGPGGSSAVRGQGIRIQKATIHVQSATVRGRGLGGGTTPAGGAGARQGFFRRGGGGGAPGSKEDSGSMLKGLGGQLANVALGAGIILGAAAAGVSALGGMRKQFLGSQMGQMRAIGITSAGGIGPMSGTGMSAGQKAQAVLAGQMSMGGGLQISGSSATTGGKLIGSNMDHLNRMNAARSAGARVLAAGGTRRQAIAAGARVLGEAPRTPVVAGSENLLASSVKFAVAQGLGGAAGAQMFGQIQELGLSRGGQARQFTTGGKVENRLARIASMGAAGGIGMRRRGQFVQQVLGLGAQARGAGMISDTGTISEVMGGLAGVRGVTQAQAQSLTGRLQQKAGAGIRGPGNMLSKIIAMEALKTGKASNMFEAMKISEEGLTGRTMDLLKSSGALKGDMGKMILSSEGFKIREAEAFQESVLQRKIGGVDVAKVKRQSLGALGAAMGSLGGKRGIEKVMFHGEQIGASKLAEKALNVQIEIMDIMKGTLGAINKLVEYLEAMF